VYTIIVENFLYFYKLFIGGIRLSKSKGLFISKETLCEYYFEEAMGIKSIAEMHHCDNDVIRRLNRTYGIELDPNIWRDGINQHIRKLLLTNTKLTDRQKSLVIGGILGDGTLAYYKVDHKECKNVYFSIAQTFRRVEFLNWFKNELTPFTPFKLTVFNSPPNEGYSVNLKTIAWDEFTALYPLFYTKKEEKRIKVVPNNIVDYLDELALAVWFMGDGHTDKSYSTISTQSFTMETMDLLKDALVTRYQLISHIRVTTAGPILNFHSKDGGNRLLHKIIDHLMVEDFYYKRLVKNFTIEEMRQSILKRDNNTCKICSNTKNISVHRIDSNINFVSDNILTICSNCSYKIQRRPNFWKNILLNIQGLDMSFEELISLYKKSPIEQK